MGHNCSSSRGNGDGGGGGEGSWSRHKNGVPFDRDRPAVTLALRLGSPACTTRGFGVPDFPQVGRIIVDVLDGLAFGAVGKGPVEARAKQAATELCARFPIFA